MSIQAVKGTRDIFSPEVENWAAYEQIARRLFRLYDFQEIRTPVFEYTEVFARGIGEDTDIVHKEMYTFPDRKGRSMTLRPENTASVVRAYVEHSMYQRAKVNRLFYIGPMFRYERPQKGRYRQFFQTGAEVFGSAHPYVDAETIELVVRLLNEVGLSGLRVDINSVGCPVCRPGYRDALRAFLADRSDELCGDCQRRLDTNPLRVLDCKVPGCSDVVMGAPSIQDHLCGDCNAHQASVLGYLDTLGVAVKLQPELVRGLDYYTRTVFEVISDGLGSQNAVLGGGRYDNLVKELGGPDTPAFGWALGMDRLMMILEDRRLAPATDVYHILPVGDDLAYAAEIGRILKDAAIPSVVMTEAPSMKSGLKQVGKAGARYALIAGVQERDNRIVVVRDMNESSQREVPLDELVKELTS